MGINVDEVYAGDTMNAAWVKAQNGGSVTGTIAHVEVREFGMDDEQKSRKVCIHLEGVDKVLGLNVTNKNILKEAWGAEAEAWIGKTLTIKTHRTAYMGKSIDGIIVEPGLPSREPAAAPAKTIVLGEAGAKRISERLAQMKVSTSLDQLRQQLNEANVQPVEVVARPPAEWPAAWMNTIKDALEALDLPF